MLISNLHLDDRAKLVAQLRESHYVQYIYFVLLDFSHENFVIKPYLSHISTI